MKMTWYGLGGNYNMTQMKYLWEILGHSVVSATHQNTTQGQCILGNGCTIFFHNFLVTETGMIWPVWVLVYFIRYLCSESVVCIYMNSMCTVKNTQWHDNRACLTTDGVLC